MDEIEKELNKLKGKTVKGIVRDKEGIPFSDEKLNGLEFTDGTIAWILSDPEGNGAGFLEIQGPK